MIHSLLNPLINTRIDKFNERNELAMVEGYKKCIEVLSHISISERKESEIEYIFNLQITEAIRLAYVDVMQQDSRRGVRLMDDIRREI